MTRALTTVPLLACFVLAGHAKGAVLTMGVGQTYTTLATAVAAANAGDTIDVLAGTYTDQVATINVPLTIVGIDGTPVFMQTSGTEIPGLKGFLTVNANLTVDNLTFQGAGITYADGDDAAGIRYQAGNLTVIASNFIGDQDGILATPGVSGTGSVVVTGSTFTGNGVATGPGAGFEHALYATGLASLTVTGSTFLGTLVGHDIKSRAAQTTVTDNDLDDGVTGSASYAIDIANGGAVTITGNTIDKGPNTGNDIMVTYGEEGLDWTDNSLSITGNVFESTYDAAIGVNNGASSVTAGISCNAFDGVPTLSEGPATLTGNVTGTTTVPACGLSVPEPPGLGAFLMGSIMLLGIRFRRHLAA